jgi:hypothetical protein
VDFHARFFLEIDNDNGDARPSPQSHAGRFEKSGVQHKGRVQDFER